MARRARHPQLRDDLDQALAVDRFGQIPGCTQRDAAAPLIDNRDDDDGDVGECRIALHGGETCPPVDVRHHDVEGHRRRPHLAHLFQPVDPARCGLDGKAFTAA